jgi:hypothetical protein
MKRLLYRCMVLFVLLSFTYLVAGCGTFLYPERLRQEPSRKVHAPTLIMDSLWLFVFIIPGVVALAVDIANGTIYYSEAELQATLSDPEAYVLLFP